MNDATPGSVMESISDITVDRTEDGSFRIDWKPRVQDLKVSIYAGQSPDTIDLDTPVIRVTNQSSVVLSDLNPGKRYYFALNPDGDSKIITAERRVKLEGAYNFRDLGGYRSLDGRRTKWGRIYRSDSLTRLTENDLTVLKQIGIRLVCDLRAPAEVKKRPDQLPTDGAIEYLNLPIVSGNFDTVTAHEKIIKGDIDWLTEDYMIKGYLYTIDAYASTWAAFFDRLAASASYPLVFHCTGGKDRAGTGAALILLALGVSEETIIHDHGLSNLFLADSMPKLYSYFSSFGIKKENLRPYLTASRAAIIALLDHIRVTYGSAADYLKKKAGVPRKTIESLKQNLLE
jgi:protein-tyrosine phosphatase